MTEFEYEFDVFLDMDIDNNAIVSKTRCPELTGGVFNKPGRHQRQTGAGSAARTRIRNCPQWWQVEYAG